MNEAEEEEMSVREELRMASIFGCVLAGEIAAYFPLRDVFAGDYALDGVVAVAAHVIITLTVGLIGSCLINAAYLMGYMTWEDFRCLFPRHEDEERSLMDFVAGIALTARCFRRAWNKGRWWPTVVDGMSVVTRGASRHKK